MSTAEQFIEQLNAHQSPEEQRKIQRYFKESAQDEFIGAHMGNVFNLAKQFLDMPSGEIEKLLENRIHEVRSGALSIMEKQVRHKKTPKARKGEQSHRMGAASSRGCESPAAAQLPRPVRRNQAAHAAALQHRTPRQRPA